MRLPRSTRLLIAILAAAAPASADVLKTRLLAGGFLRPVWVGAPAGDHARLFVVEQDGRIRVVRDGVVLATPFLDIDAEVTSVGREQGLLGLAFHPQYAANGKYYVCFTDNTLAIEVREYVASATPSLGVDVSDTGNWRTVVGPIPKAFPTHNGGCLAFGPDGKLYVSTGDGGGVNDTGPGHDPVTGNAQSLTSLFGKMLRIDVDTGPPWDPLDNPWSSDADGVDDLIWAIGLRNPWRFAFDAANGDLYVADVGQNAWEEIDWLPHAGGFGANFGWRCQEALHCTTNGGCVCNVPPGANPALVDPVIEYPHGTGHCAVTGGVVYRGSWIPGLAGTYFYGDYCSHAIWSTQIVAGVAAPSVDRTAELDPPGPDTIRLASHFGTEAHGEIVLCDYLDGELYRIEAVCAPPVAYCIGAPNSVGPGARMAWTGTNEIGLNDLGLVCTGLPPTAPGFFLYGRGQAQVPLGNGFLCIADDHWRLASCRRAPERRTVRSTCTLSPRASIPARRGRSSSTTGTSWAAARAST